GEYKLLEANGPPPGAVEGAEQGPERKLADDRVQLESDHVLGGVRLETKAQWQRHSLVEVSDEAPSGTGALQEGTTFDLLLNTGAVDVLVHHGGLRGVTGTIGASGVYQMNDSRGPIALVPDVRIGSAAGFACAQVKLVGWPW